MKTHFSLLFSFCLLVGCASKKDIEVTMMRVRPLGLNVEVRSVKERFDSSPGRYFVELAVVQPQAKKGQILHFVLDGVYSDVERRFVVAGTKWKIRSDEEAFDHERIMGFSFWDLRDVHPVPEEEPNQSPQPTAPSGRG